MVVKREEGEREIVIKFALPSLTVATTLLQDDRAARVILSQKTAI